MSWNRENWKTTLCGGLAAVAIILETLAPEAAPIAKAAEALAVAFFGYFAQG